MESCNGYELHEIVENVLAFVSSLQLVSNPLFASQVRDTQIACGQSCQCPANAICDASSLNCTNGIACPSSPTLYRDLYASSIFFTIFPIFVGAAFLVFKPSTEEEFVQSEKASSSANSKGKKIKVVQNGIELGVYYLYSVMTCRSRESCLKHYEMVASKLRVLRQHVVLWPIYGLCRVFHFLYLASNPTVTAKILFPTERTSDQDLATPLVQIVETPDQSHLKVTNTPAIVIATHVAFTRNHYGYVLGLVFKSLPLFFIQVIYIDSVLAVGVSAFSFLVTGFHLVLVAGYALHVQIKSDMLQAKQACEHLMAFYVNQGYPESTLSCIVTRSVDPKDRPRSASVAPG
jgi:hypothetical protein